MTNITPYIQLAIAIIGAIFTYIIIPYIKAKKTSEEINADIAKGKKMLEDIKILVAAADQIGKNLGYDGEKKLMYVKGRLEAMGYIIDDSICDMIEAAVLNLHNQLIEEYVIE